MELSNSVLLKINKLQNFAGNERTVVMEIMVGVDSVPDSNEEQTNRV